ncbi:hypothetical protein [Bartonella machadoae]|uniref:hypothetical protein n=1 Tax=Bartonella machadoae TaxID=2893471 RepID=UPI001F4C5A7F|nr:hypothetical protein [Bartonella machadoae]UNE53943.1 hypothetical protein LNM86_10220 [Bartonella machadoae]
MTSSFVTFLTLNFLTSVIMSFIVTVPILVIYTLFFKRARLYCKAKTALKVLQECDARVEKQ